MSIQFCPICHTTRNMRIVVLPRKELNGNGQTRKVETRTYHCEVCNTFVRNEEIELIRSVWGLGGGGPQ